MRQVSSRIYVFNLAAYISISALSYYSKGKHEGARLPRNALKSITVGGARYSKFSLVLNRESIYLAILHFSEYLQMKLAK